MLGNVGAGHGQKPREEGGRDYPLKLGPELGFARSGLTSFWNGLDELAGLADPRASERRAMKATLAEIGQSRDDWRREAELRRPPARADRLAMLGARVRNPRMRAQKSTANCWSLGELRFVRQGELPANLVSGRIL